MYYIFIYFNINRNSFVLFSLENDSSGLIYLRRIKNKQEILSCDNNFSKNV